MSVIIITLGTVWLRYNERMKQTLFTTETSTTQPPSIYAQLTALPPEAVRLVAESLERRPDQLDAIRHKLARANAELAVQVLIASTSPEVIAKSPDEAFMRGFQVCLALAERSDLIQQLQIET